jgi:hypothetical protein
MHITIEYATPLPGSTYEILKKEVAKCPYNLKSQGMRENGQKVFTVSEPAISRIVNMIKMSLPQGKLWLLTASLIRKDYYRGKSISKWG